MLLIFIYFSKMNPQTFSRSFLQQMPELHKQKLIDTIIQGFIQYLQNAAAAGRTSYTFEIDGISPTITNDDLVAAFRVKFPDCKISYQDKMEKASLFQKVLKKTIVIDWS